MGIGSWGRRAVDWLTLADARAVTAEPSPRVRALRTLAARKWAFDANFRPVDEVITEMWHGQGRATQEEALAVPGVLRARNIIVGPATWPLVDLGADNRRHRNPLLEQTDPNVPNVVTWAQVMQDLLFEGISWMRVLETGSRGYPTRMEHLDYHRVSVQPIRDADGMSPLPSTAAPRERGQLAQIMVDGEPADHRLIKRFDSPNPGVLLAAGATIRTAATYRKTAQMYANNPRMDGFLYPKEGADPVEDAQVQELLDEWEDARRAHTTGYVPAALGYEQVNALSPADLQLMQLHDQATRDVALALGLEPEDLGISTTSRTYANVVDRRIDRINDLLSAYILAVTQRMSMGDITPAGHRVYADPNTYLRANPGERVAYYQGMAALGVLDADDIADAEQVPRKPQPAAVTPGQPRGSVTPIRSAQPGSASRLAAAADITHTFELEAVGRLETDPSHVWAASPARRTITGIAVPYGPTHIGRKNGRKFRFQQGSIRPPADPRHVPLLIDHVQSASVGHMLAIDDTADGLHVVAKVMSGPAGDQALAWASPEESVRTGFSVGVDFDEQDCVPDPENPGVLLVPVGAAVLRENSLVAVPAFEGARVASVTLSADTGGTVPAPTGTDTQQQPPGTGPAPTTPPQPQQPGTPQPAPAPEPAPNQTFTADQLGAVMAQFLRAAPVDNSGAGPQFVDPVARPVPGQSAQPPATRAAAVTEAAPYRFDYEGNLTPGPQYDFSNDLVRAGRDRDSEAYRRCLAFMREMTVGQAYGMRRHAFADVDRTDVAGLNPTRQRPDLYVDQRDYRYPLYEATRRGTLTDITAFTLPKFNTAAGLVATHTEGTEPTPGSFTVTTQTITPTAKSGAIDMTREAWDQGGSPQASALIWRQFTRAWFEALESGVATFLNTLTAATDIALGTAVVDSALAKAWRTAIARLQFARGGSDRFDMMATEQELYVALATAETDAGEPLFPMIGAANRDGTSRTRYSALDVAGVTSIPSWALASTAGSVNNSWLFDSEVVHTWDTGPQRLEFPGMDASGNYAPVAYVRLAVWGYQALANTDISGVRQITYDTTV
jgi:hypothetical protein